MEYNKVKIKKNLLLDHETIEILESYSIELSGSKNISSGVRSMARAFLILREKTNKDSK